MKISILTVLYEQIVDDFYQYHSHSNTSYTEQKQEFDNTVSLWATGWNRALLKCGHEVLTITINAHQLQAAWAQENGFPSTDSKQIALEQIRRFKPDVLWYDYFDIPLLKEIKSSVSSLRLVLGWTGSAIVSYNVFQEIDLVISCAPEAVQTLHDYGIKAYHLHHAFDPYIISSIQKKQKHYGVTFVGQIVRGREFHTERERLLKRLAVEVELSIFSPAYSLGIKDVLLTPIRQAAYLLARPIHWFGATSFFHDIERLRKILELRERPNFPFDRNLKSKLKPPVFGINMYQCLSDSQAVLNIHADSSPLHASNMRLFETTGIGTCLVTDWRQNINELFIEDEEVVTYRSIEDCVNKLKWLMNIPLHAEKIAERGQHRTLRDHTYDVRSTQLLEIIHKAMK